MVLSPGMDQVYGMSEKWTSIADFITSGIFDLKTQPEALDLLNNFVRAIGLIPVIVMEQPSQGMSLDDKVIAYMQTCAAAIILATGDDKVEGGEHLQPRQNVIHEIGIAQQVLTNRITYLLEEGTEFPSNIVPKVYERFTNNKLGKAFIAIVRDLRAFGILQ